MPELGRQRQADLYKFEASLVCRASFRTARAVIQRNPVSSWAVVAHAFNPSTREVEAADLCEFEASLVYKS